MNFYGQLEPAAVPAAVPAAALASPAASKGFLQQCDDSTLSEIITAPSSRVRRSRAPSREPMGRRIRTRSPVNTSNHSISSSSEEGALSELASSTPVAPGAMSPPRAFRKRQQLHTLLGWNQQQQVQDCLLGTHTQLQT